MAYDYIRRVGDLGPPLRAQLLDADGAAIDLTGLAVTAIQCKITRPDGTVASADVTAIETALTGKVRYNYVAADVATAGDAKVRWYAALTASDTRTFPVFGYQTLKVSE
jgi:hypothetical protein